MEAETTVNPRLTPDLEEDIVSGMSPTWHAKALRSLAHQLGMSNDFYYPLLGAARLLDNKRGSA